MSEYEKKIMNSGKKPTKRSLSLCMIETENPTFEHDSPTSPGLSSTLPDFEGEVTENPIGFNPIDDRSTSSQVAPSAGSGQIMSPDASVSV